jgi:chromosome segregation ATPase
VLVSVFIYKVHIHNTSHCQPDVVCTLSAVLQGPPTLDDIRYVDSGGLAEQQAALLHYQQDNLQHLSKEILRLQESLSKYEHTQDGNTPQVDLVHLLAAREQELRAIAAERDQLQAEVRLARGFISERDADILRVRAINDQYVEENERLRAMLDEWSSRTAKVSYAITFATVYQYPCC